MFGIFLFIFLIAGFVIWYKKSKPAQDPNFNYSIDDRYNLDRLSTEKEIDRILEKINKRGMASLSQQEKELLEHYSRIKN